MRQPKLTHEKRTAPTVAKQNLIHKPIESMQKNGAYAFLPNDKNATLN
jgi:hypothetical protein